jgi:hypothetical protein
MLPFRVLWQLRLWALGCSAPLSGPVLLEVNTVFDAELSPGQLLAQIGGMI